LIAGVGQLYVGRYLRAAVFLSLEVLTAALYLHYTEELGAILNIAVSVYTAFDAYRLAVKLNKEAPEKKADEIPVVFIQ
jgi:hypothetical protein